uniref:Peptidase S1 domain-containing protein n=1 Tax=Steinernema glaseri TaxID=37863 RepID=A0A1I7ZTQ6_9BILA
MRILLSIIALAGLSLAAPPPPVLPPPSHRSSELIFGGHQAYQGQFPYFVYLYDIGCGGTLLTPKLVLTAAHCVDDSRIGGQVVMGIDNDKDYVNVTGVQIRKFASYIAHNEYNDTFKRNDIAIVEVDEPFDLTEYAQLVNIKADDTKLQERYWTTIVGFGPIDIVNRTLEYPDQLQYAYVPIVNHKYCESIWGMWGLWEKHICGGSAGVGTGQGDSGGPMSVRQDDKYYQIGITSFGPATINGLLNQDKYPSAFTRTASYCDWIHDNTNGAFSCIE